MNENDYYKCKRCRGFFILGGSYKTKDGVFCMSCYFINDLLEKFTQKIRSLYCRELITLEEMDDLYNPIKKLKGMKNEKT